MNNQLLQEKLKILIVDDEEIIISSIKLHLRREERYELFAANSVADAIKIMQSYPINIILTDLMMPEIDGLEFLSIINEHDPSIITMMITGYATINSALQANQLGAFDYIAKPFTKEELTKAVKRAADLALVAQANTTSGQSSTKLISEKGLQNNINRGIGEHSWIIKEFNDTVTIGVERPFLYNIGKISTVYLPSKGDELRQGAVYFQIFSSELRSWSLLSPLSGKVVEVNQFVIDHPNKALSDPYGDGWLIRILPSDFDSDIKILGR